MADKIKGARMDAHFQIHGVDQLRASLTFNMTIEDWKKVRDIISEHRQQLPYSTYSEFLNLIGVLLTRVSNTSFVEELEDKDAEEKPEEKHVKA